MLHTSLRLVGRIPLDRVLNHVPLALEDGLDGSVPKVPHVSAETELSRPLLAVGPEVHALDESVENDPSPCDHRRAR